MGHVGHHCPENGRDPSGRDFHSCHPGEKRERETKPIMYHKPHKRMDVGSPQCGERRVRLNNGDKKRDSGVSKGIA